MKSFYKSGVLIPVLMAAALAACGRAGDISLLGMAGSGGSVASSPALSVSGISHSYGNAEYFSTTAAPSINWSAVEGVDGSSMQYEVALGTGSTGSTVNNAMDWTPVGAVTSYSASNLALSNKQNYYAHVRLANAAGKGPSAASTQPWKAIQMDTIELYQKNTTTWNIIAGGGTGTMRYSMRRGTIKFDFTATGLAGMGIANGTNMTLVYWHDNGAWPNDGMLCFGYAAVSGGGISISGDVNFGINIPKPTDLNVATGGKIWLLPSAAIQDQTAAARGTTCTGIVGATATTTFRYNPGAWNTYKDLTLYENSVAMMNYLYEP